MAPVPVGALGRLALGELLRRQEQERVQLLTAIAAADGVPQDGTMQLDVQAMQWVPRAAAPPEAG